MLNNSLYDKRSISLSIYLFFSFFFLFGLSKKAVGLTLFSPPKKIRYKTLSWELVAALMIAEIVSNGMLSLPSSLAVVGLVPGIVLIVFLGVFGLFTAWILIQFKLRHPEGI